MTAGLQTCPTCGSEIPPTPPPRFELRLAWDTRIVASARTDALSGKVTFELEPSLFDPANRRSAQELEFVIAQIKKTGYVFNEATRFDLHIHDRRAS